MSLGGARPDEMESFVDYAMSKDSQYFEWRFRGKFGMGGKCRRPPYPTPHMKIDYYPESATPELNMLQSKINCALLELGPPPQD